MVTDKVCSMGKSQHRETAECTAHVANEYRCTITIAAIIL